VNRSESILAIHIDDNFLNVVHLGRTAKGLRIFASDVIPLEEGLVKDGQIVNTESVSGKIRHFVSHARPKPHNVVMLPSCTAVRLKPSEFPNQPKDQIQNLVEEQIREYTFFGSREIVFDYCVFAARNDDTQTVLQAVVTRRISDAYLAVARQAKLNLLRITPAVMPVIKLMFDKASLRIEDVSLLLAIEPDSGNISVYKNARPRLCQNLTIGVNNILSDTDSQNALARQLKPVLEFAHSIADLDQLVLKVVASCSSDKSDLIVDGIKSAFNDLKVEHINSTDIIERFDIKADDNRHPPIFAFIAALDKLDVYEFDGQLNLISKDSLKRQKTKNEMSLLAKCIIAVILLSIAATYPIEMKLKTVEAASARVEGKITRTIPMKRKVAGIKKQIKQLKEQNLAYAAAFDMLTDTPWSQILRDIAENIPNEVRILDVSSSTDLTNFVVIGQALAESNVYRFVKKLKNSDFIDTAKVEEVEYSKDGNATLLNYKITCKIHLPGSNL